MIGSLAFIFIFGLMFAYMSEKLGLPRLVGMLIAGIVIGCVAAVAIIGCVSFMAIQKKGCFTKKVEAASASP